MRKLLAVMILAGLVPASALALSITNVVIQTATVGTGQTYQHTSAFGSKRLFAATAVLPSGDPFSSASWTIEFTISGGGASILLFGNLPSDSQFGAIPGFPGFSSSVLALPPGPVPWNLSVTFVRLGANPFVYFAGDESDTETQQDIDRFEWADTGFAVPDGRYRFSVYASQVGGLIPAGVHGTLIVNPIPEPSGAAAFAFGAALVWCAIRRNTSRP